MGLYSDLLERLQDVDEYGGGATTFLLRRAVFDAIDNGADDGDQTLVGLRRDIRDCANAWTNVEDHVARSSLFATYCEATFYLAGGKRVSLEGIPRGPASTPDFKSVQKPSVRFEVKTLDIADPTRGYAQQMEEGLDGNIEAHEEASRRGIGFSERIVSPHGAAQTWPEIIEQTMRKLAGNINANQYADAPTFLVANLGRLSVRVDPEQLDGRYTIPGEETFCMESAEVSGELWTIANHVLGTAFNWLDQDSRVQSIQLNRAGLLRDFPFVQGIIFTTEPWSEFGRAEDWRDAYRFLGVWNEDCTFNCEEQIRDEARRVLGAICTRVVATR